MCSIGVVPGAIGLTGIHLLSYGIPVISNNDSDNQKPEWEAIIPGINGDYFEKNDISDLSKKVKMWIQKEQNLNRKQYRKIIDEFYNPEYQMSVIISAVKAVKRDYDETKSHK